MLGLSYDWTREIATCDPEYFKWTQWIFCQLYKKGLAELKEIEVNWCEGLGTVLANEEIINVMVRWLVNVVNSQLKNAL